MFNLSKSDKVVQAWKQRYASLRPLIKKHFEFLETQHGFDSSNYTMGNTKSKSCCIQFQSKKNPSMEIIVGTWFPDFEIELSFFMSDKPNANPYGHMAHDNYDIEDINRVLNGFDCKKLPTHSCYSYDESLADEVLRQMSPLVGRFIEEALADRKSVYGVLDRIREVDTKRGEEIFNDARARFLAGQAWECEDYSTYIKHIESLSDQPTATETKLVYIAKKAIENNGA